MKKKDNKSNTYKTRKLNSIKIIIAFISIILVIIITSSITHNINLKNSNYATGAGNSNSNLLARYIRKGITIGGITGTLEALDTSDATATQADIRLGKTAYVNGVKITGTCEELYGEDTEFIITNDMTIDSGTYDQIIRITNGANVQIKGGTFNNELILEDGNLQISGGYFIYNIDQYLAEYCYTVISGEYYKVVVEHSGGTID